MNTETPKDGDTIAVWFSCGAASAVAAWMTLHQYRHRCNVRVVNSPVIEEDEDNRRFLKDVEQWLGIKIEIAINEKFPSCSAVDVWEKRQYMSGIAGAPCTKELKKEARYQWEVVNKPDWHVLGFTSEERGRFERFRITERDNVLHILEGVSKAGCFEHLRNAGITLPRSYSRGYPNANCKGCPKATSPTYWNHVRVSDPDVFQKRAEQSRRIGARLVRVKGKRLFLDELPADAKGQPMKNMNFECGVFCEITN